MPLKPIFAIPEHLPLIGINRESDDPRLCISVVPRRVQWETGKFSWITKTPGEDGTEELRFDYRLNRKLKPRIIASKMIALIKTKRADEPDTPRSTPSEAKEQEKEKC